MSKSDPAGRFDAARHLETMEPVLGLTITDEQRPMVLQFLTIAHGMSKVVLAAPLDPSSLELAAVFRPGAVEQAS